ncbi:MAG: hypothetical protein ACLQNE_09350 [Thermoguttaceae bacterium]
MVGLLSGSDICQRATMGDKRTPLWTSLWLLMAWSNWRQNMGERKFSPDALGFLAR